MRRFVGTESRIGGLIPEVLLGIHMSLPSRQGTYEAVGTWKRPRDEMMGPGMWEAQFA